MASKVDSQIADALFRLALNALNEKPNEAAVVSPFSIALALATVNVGARGATSAEITERAFAGIPKNQMTAWFRERLDELREYEAPLAIASAIYLEQTLSLLERYPTDLAQNFGSSVEKVDFATDHHTQRALINQFVKEATKEYIPELFGEGDLSSDTKLVAVNAIYLKSNFSSKFYKEDTKEEPFYNEDGTNKQVETMNGCKKGRFFENDDYAFAELHFQGYGFSFFFAVPKTGVLSELKDKLASSQNFSTATLEAAHISFIYMALPKFKTEASYQLKDALERLGIKEAFRAGANLSAPRSRSMSML